jgi:hypothetical protein
LAAGLQAGSPSTDHGNRGEEHEMALGGNYDSHQEHFIDMLYAEGAAGRLAKEAKAVIGYKSPFRRILELLRPHRQEPRDSPERSQLGQ